MKFQLTLPVITLLVAHCAEQATVRGSGTDSGRRDSLTLRGSEIPRRRELGGSADKLAFSAKKAATRRNTPASSAKRQGPTNGANLADKPGSLIKINRLDRRTTKSVNETARSSGRKDKLDRNRRKDRVQPPVEKEEQLLEPQTEDDGWSCLSWFRPAVPKINLSAYHSSIRLHDGALFRALSTANEGGRPVVPLTAALDAYARTLSDISGLRRRHTDYLDNLALIEKQISRLDRERERHSRNFLKVVGKDEARFDFMLGDEVAEEQEAIRGVTQRGDEKLKQSQDKGKVKDRERRAEYVASVADRHEKANRLELACSMIASCLGMLEASRTAQRSRIVSALNGRDGGQPDALTLPPAAISAEVYNRIRSDDSFDSISTKEAEAEDTTAARLPGCLLVFFRPSDDGEHRLSYGPSSAGSCAQLTLSGPILHGDTDADHFVVTAQGHRLVRADILNQIAVALAFRHEHIIVDVSSFLVQGVGTRALSVAYKAAIAVANSIGIGGRKISSLTFAEGR